MSTGKNMSCKRTRTPVMKALSLALLALLVIVPGTQAAEIPATDPVVDPPNSPITGVDDATPSCGAGGDSCAANSDVGSSPADKVQPGNSVGNPINLMTGNKYQSEVDFQIPGAMLSLKRMYNSGNSDSNLGLGQGWYHSYSVNLFDSGNGTRQIVQSNGARLTFEEQGTDENGYPLYRSVRSHQGYLTFENKRHYWHLSDGRIMKFNGTFLVEIDWPDQRKLKLFYRSQRLHTVTDETGRVLRFAYSGNRQAEALPAYDKSRFGSAPGYLESVTLPDGSVIGYDYDDKRNLTRARFPDGTSREYHYEDETYPNHLTGLTDRTGVRFASWGYDGEGRAISSEHAGGVEKVTLQYPERKVAESGEVVETLVTNSLGAQSVYTWQKPAGTGQEQLLSSSGAGCATCPETGMAYEYDEQGRLLSSLKTRLGNSVGLDKVSYTYDEQGRTSEIRRVDSAGQDHLVERRAYEGAALQPLRIYRPSVNPDGERISEIQRDASGRPVTIIERGYSPWMALPDEPEYVDGAGKLSEYRPIESITQLTYNANGQLISTDGPRSGMEDITHYSWDERVRLTGIEPAKNPAIQLSEFDAQGRPTVLQIGVQSPYQITYGMRGEILEIMHRTQRVSLSYDAEERLVSLTDSDGRFTQLTYDEAGRTTSMIDPFGRELRTGYDSESRAQNKAIHGIDGTLVHALTMVFDTNGRLAEQSEQRQRADGNLASTRTLLDYDVEGQLAGATDAANGARVAVELDLLNRTRAWIAPGGQRTTYHFDTIGQEAGLEDARGNETHHWRDDFGRRVAVISADTGRERLERNAAGDVVARVREDSGITQYTHDAAGRILRRGHSDGKVTRFTYEALNGRLASIATDNAEETFTYNVEGQLLAHVRQFDTHQFETHWAYDARGRIVKQQLPDGQTLSYYYHDSGPNVGQLRAITRDRLMGMAEQMVVSDIDLEKHDGTVGWLAHNSLRTKMQLAAGGEVTAIDTDNMLTLQYDFDDRGRIVGITEDGDKRRFAYDGSRISLATNKQAEIRYAYDAVGNRLSRQTIQMNGESSIERYTYATPGSGNRLLEQIDTMAGVSERFTYDAAGSPVKRGDIETIYDNERRPIRVQRNDSPIADYTYNGFGERIKKVVYRAGEAPTITYYLYSNNTLVAEADEEGAITTQYLYLESHRPVAQFVGNAIHAIHTDHLGTPLRMSDESGEIIWSAEYTPFGKATVSTETQTLALRFPGQYFDAETGTHYNYFRDYDPDLGRYLSADPIGLAGGIHAYGYVSQNPLQSIDPLGLLKGDLTRYYRALLQAGTFAAADGPLPVGDAVAAAFLLSYLVQDIVLDGLQMPDLSQADLSENYNAVMEQVRLYEPGFGDVHDGSWQPSEQDLRDITNRLVRLQQGYISDFNAAGECTAELDQATYENARDAEAIRRLIGEGVEGAVAGVIIDGVWFPSENAARSAQAQFDRSGTDLTFREWWAQVTAAHGPTTMSQFSTIREINERTGQTLGRDGDSSVLRANMTDRGVTEPANHDAHHIVAGGSSNEDAEASRDILTTFGIDVNEAVNGVYLPRCTRLACPPATTHSRVHTGDYFREVLRRLQGAETAQEARDILRQIARDLASGTLAF